MTKAWAGFWRLGGFERGVALEAAAVLIATRAGLRLLGFRRWQVCLHSLTPAIDRNASSSEQETTTTAGAIARVQESAANHLFFQANCLEQSLALWWLLQRRGVTAQLRIGARKDKERFEAHAWVEWNGVVLNDRGTDHQHFVPFDRPIGSMEMQTP
jgi:hypothetical protein